MPLTREQSKELLLEAKKRKPGMTRDDAMVVLSKANQVIDSRKQALTSIEPEVQEEPGFVKKGVGRLFDFLNVPSSLVAGQLQAAGEVARGEFRAPEIAKFTIPTIKGPRELDIGELINPSLVGLVRGFREKKDVLTELPTAVGLDPESKKGLALGFIGELLVPDAFDAVAGLKILKKGIKSRKAVTIAPFGKDITTEAIESAQKLGIDLPLSAKTKNQFVQQVEALAQKSFFGGDISRKITKAFDDVGSKLDDLTAKFTQEQNLDSIGKSISGDLDKFADNFQLQKRKLYGNVPKSIQGIKVDPIETLNALDEMIQRKTKGFIDNAFTSKITKLADNIVKEDRVTYQMLNETQREIGKMISNFVDPVASGNKAELRKIYASLAADMDKTLKIVDPASFDLIKAADKFYADGISLLNDKVVKSVLRKSPTDLFKFLSKPGKEKELGLIKRIMGVESFNEFKGEIVQKIFNDSVDTKGKISSQKLSTQLRKFGDNSLEKFLEPDQFARIKELQGSLEEIQIVGDALKAGNRAAAGSQTAFLLNTLTVGGFFANPPAAIAWVLGQAGATKALGKDITQKFLTEGLQVPGKITSAVREVPSILKGAGKVGALTIEEILKTISRGDNQQTSQARGSVSAPKLSSLERIQKRESQSRQSTKVLPGARRA